MGPTQLAFRLCITRRIFLSGNYFVERDIVVGIATHYGLDVPTIEFWWECNFPRPSRLALGTTHIPIQWVPGHCCG